MTEKEILYLRGMLLDRRRDIWDQVRQMEDRWQDLTEREIEVEEEAQKASITESYDRLDERGKSEIEQIDVALGRIALGEYGVCESCGDDISVKRLEALPWARLCVDCAREYERKGKSLPPTVEMIGSARIPDDYQDLSNDQIVSMIYDHFRNDGRVDTEEIEISIRSGVIYLDGNIPGEAEHQVIVQALTDLMGFSTIVDHLELNEPTWGMSGRIHGRSRPKATVSDRIFYDRENPSESLFEGRDEEPPYSSTDGPAPFQE